MATSPMFLPGESTDRRTGRITIISAKSWTRLKRQMYILYCVYNLIFCASIMSDSLAMDCSL